MAALKLKKEYIEEQRKKEEVKENDIADKTKKKTDYFSEKIIILISVILIMGIINGYISTPSHLIQDNLSVYIARILGGMVGFSGVIILLSFLLSFIFYLLFNKIAQKYKNYNDYLGLFLILGAVLSLIILLTMMNR